MLKKLLHLVLPCAIAVGAILALPAQAAWPDRPIRMILPFPAGSSTDAVARQIAAALGATLGTTVVVESVPGAGGTLATARVAKSPADGYTILFTAANHTINPALYPNLPFDTEKDLTAVSLVAEIPELLVASASVPFSDFAGFVKYARANPDKLNYASAGNGTLPHVTMELLLQKLGLRVTHVPYKGAAPAMTDLLGGQVSLKMDTILSSMPHIASGKIKPLALASLHRSPLLPNVPTIAESGVPGYEGIMWMGILVPSQTPKDIVNTLHKAVAAAVRTPALVRRFEAEGVLPVGSEPAEFERLIASEVRKWGELIKRAKIKAD